MVQEGIGPPLLKLPPHHSPTPLVGTVRLSATLLPAALAEELVVFGAAVVVISEPTTAAGSVILPAAVTVMSVNVVPVGAAAYQISNPAITVDSSIARVKVIAPLLAVTPLATVVPLDQKKTTTLLGSAVPMTGAGVFHTIVLVPPVRLLVLSVWVQVAGVTAAVPPQHMNFSHLFWAKAGEAIRLAAPVIRDRRFISDTRRCNRRSSRLQLTIRPAPGPRQRTVR